MRIAVSATHCAGKTTLVEDFLAVHRDYVHEPEPYEWLEEIYGEPLAAEPTPDDFWRQLEISVERLTTYAAGANVIAERSPLDFLAYLLALSDLGRGDRTLIDPATDLAVRGLAHVDLLVVLPLDARAGIRAPASEDLALRDAMNERLIELIRNDELGLFADGAPRVVEVSGGRAARVAALERALAHNTV